MTSKKPRRGRGEGSIFQRKDGRYAASMSIEGQERKRKYFYGKTRAEVREKLPKAQLEQRQGILATGPKQTVKNFLNYWLEVHKAKIKARQLLDVAKESHLLCLLTLALATGMRLGELLALCWEEIDLGKGVLQYAIRLIILMGMG